MRDTLKIASGDREFIGRWLLQHLPDVLNLPAQYEAIGVARGDELVGGCLYSNFAPYPSGGDIQIWAVGHGWLSRRVIKVMLGYPFEQLKCRRLTALTRKNNKQARGLLEGLGFKLEGVHPHLFGNTKHGVSYGMLRENCRWLG